MRFWLRTDEARLAQQLAVGRSVTVKFKTVMAALWDFSHVLCAVCLLLAS